MFGRTLPLSVSIAPEANRNTPIAVDLLLVRDKKVLEAVQELEARSWFSKDREQYVRDFPEAFELRSWEWVPGQPIAALEVEIPPGIRKAVVFADYFAPGAHRAVFDPRKPTRIILGEMSFTAEPQKE